jgi:pseudouridine-5'-phosphate glycosidase
VADSLDISADLAALSRYPLIVVCSGAKSILDVPKTLEALESTGVPVVGYRTSELPAFYSAKSGLNLEIRADDPASIVRIARTHWELGFSTSILVTQPVPRDSEVPLDEMQSTIAGALELTEREGVRGKDVTPYLLRKVVEVVGSRALEANIALLRQNARLAGAIAACLAQSGGDL